MHHRVHAISFVAVAALTFAYTFRENNRWISYFGLVHKSNAVLQYNNSSCKPLGIHLALGSDVHERESTSTTVSFYLPYMECLEARPVVRYGRKGKESDPIAAYELEPLHISFTSRKTKNKTILSDWVYHAELSGLLPGEKEYWYRIDVIADALRVDQEQKVKHSLFRASWVPRNLLVGEMHYFRTSPLLGSPTNFAIVADVGDTRVSQLTIQGIENASLPQANKHPVTLAIIAGDITYGDAEPWY